MPENIKWDNIKNEKCRNQQKENSTNKKKYHPVHAAMCQYSCGLDGMGQYGIDGQYNFNFKQPYPCRIFRLSDSADIRLHNVAFGKNNAELLKLLSESRRIAS